MSLGRREALAACALLAIWLAVVVFTTAHHEYWRDEVRPLTMARAAATPWDLYELTKYDGHPPLWFLLLHAGTWITSSSLILPVLSIAIGLAAVSLFLFQAPFPLWLRGLFVFSALPLYEYAVMARNYGISMLLLFAAAWLYPRRERRPWSLALVLALLANTNAHSAVLAGLVAGVWAWDAAAGGRLRRLAMPLAVVAAGLLVCALFALPRRSTILTGVYSASADSFAGALMRVASRPDLSFAGIVPSLLPPVVSIVLLYLAILGLAGWPRLLLAALAGMVALGVLFRVVYPGAYRHQGLLLVFLIFLYWLARAGPGWAGAAAWRRRLLQAGLYVGVLGLIVPNVARSYDRIATDLHRQLSSSRAFGAFLAATPAYRDAILVPEPDLYLESLPYYADNPIYLPREQRFGRTVSWTTDASARLSLGELLAAARGVQARSKVPVLLVLGHRDLEGPGPQERRGEYNKWFAWTPAEVADLARSTRLVADFNAAVGDENYQVLALLAPPAPGRP